MSVLDLEAPIGLTPPVAPGRRAGDRTRPTRGTGRGARPAARPRTAVAPPSLDRPGVTGPRGCAEVVALPVPRLEQESSWRLTERGIAVVLVVATMIVVAALAVVVPTALRVTGEHYQPAGLSQAGSR